MPYEAFVEKSFKRETIQVIDQANLIIDIYRGQGFALTLRQLYYQFVARGMIPNKQSEYKRLGSIINDGRLAGLIDWSAIEDRTRELNTITSWTDPEEIIRGVADQYREDLWLTQRNRVEVWVEKEALLGVIEVVCKEQRVPYFACRGYTSQSEAYAAGKRMEFWRRRGQRPVVLHLGDHDPSGLDMTRDNRSRLEMFSRMSIPVKRLALNMDQIERYTPPPNPAKDTDARFGGYAAEYGDESWELDALEPSVIADLIRTEVEALRDGILWDRALDAERDNRELLARASERWDDVAEFLENEGENP